MLRFSPFHLCEMHLSTKYYTKKKFAVPMKFSVENSLNDFYSFVDARSFSNTSTRHISYILTLHVVFGCTGASVGLTNRAF